jgi:glycosyltransferase involved in cell wall biosynthesis
MIISVVIPVYNDAAHLERCLGALAAQSRPADEIVVVDNASTDASAEVAVRAGARVVVEEKRGIPQASAAGFDAASGTVIARLDADCIPPADWLARIDAAFSADARLGMLTGSARFHDAGPVVGWAGRYLYLGWYFSAMGMLLGHPPVFGSNFAMRVEAWQRLRHTMHRDDAETHDDLDLSFQVPPGMRVVFDRDLEMEISSRPFKSARSFARRSVRGFHTIVVNFPPRRRRRLAAIADRRSRLTASTD